MSDKTDSIESSLDGGSEHKGQRTPAHQWTVKFLYDEFEDESDRAAVILVASLMDEALLSLLNTYFVPIAQSQDPLFDNATAPLSTFSAKIDTAHRVGLLSVNLCRDIHLVRKIRNSFAHDIHGCSFSNGSVRSRIDELYKSVVGLDQEDDADPRRKFLYIACGILWSLNNKINQLEKLNPPELEYLYVP